MGETQNEIQNDTKRKYWWNESEENAQKHKNSMLKYYYNNKEQINERRMRIVECDCGIRLCRSSLSKHKRTKKHTLLMNNKM
jgi:hypothetical protein